MTHRLIQEADAEIRRLRHLVVYLEQTKLTYAERMGVLIQRLRRYEDITDVEDLLPWHMKTNKDEINDPEIRKRR